MSEAGSTQCFFSSFLQCLLRTESVSACPQTCHYKLIDNLCVPAMGERCRPCFYCVLVLPSQCLKGIGRGMNAGDGR